MLGPCFLCSTLCPSYEVVARLVFTHSKISCKTPYSGYCIIIKVIYITVSLVGLVEFFMSATISDKTKQSLIANYDSNESRYQRLMCDPTE